MRLAKYLAAAGIASRRAAEEIIRAERVTVRGLTTTDPATDVDEDDAVAVDGTPVVAPTRTVVYAINKPAGVVSTASDPQGRRTVVSLIPSERRLYPVGRLDIDTTGLILVTDDGALANHLTHPRYEVKKTYVAIVRHPPVREPALRQLRDGVQLDDGRSAPARVRRLGPDTIELTLREGHKRQVRRMCEQVGHPVRQLSRVRLGPLELGALKPGAYRKLSTHEVEALRRAGRGSRPDADESNGARGRSRGG